MKDVNSSALISHFRTYLEQARQEPIGILRQNTRMAVLMSIEEFERYKELKQAFATAASDDSAFARRWVELEKASRLQSELAKR